MRILIFGASIVQGLHDTQCGGWVSRLTADCNRKIVESDFEYSNNTFNLGISGECSSKILVRFDNETRPRLEGRDGAVVFSVGVNDTQRYVEDGTLRTTPEQFEQNIRSLIVAAKKYTSHIHCLGILPIVEHMVQPMPWATNREHREQDVLAFCAIIEKVCQEEEVNYSDMQDVFGDDKEKYLHDGIHPDTAGHQIVFERVKTELEKAGIL